MKIIALVYSPNDENLCKKIETKFRDHDTIWHFNYFPITSENDLKNVTSSSGNFDYIFYIVTKNSQNNKLFKDEIQQLKFKNSILVSFIGKVSSPLKSLIFENSSADEFEKLIESVGGLESSVVKYAQIQRPVKINPFGAVRAEYFKNSSIIASIFYPPEKQKYDYLIGSRPVIIEGGRGSGKTMCLRSLDANTAIQRTKTRTMIDPDLNYFGIYMHVTRGSFVLTSQRELNSLGDSKSNVLFLDDINLQFTEQLLRTIKECMNNNYITLSKEDEFSLSNKICELFGSKETTPLVNFDSLINWIEKQKRHIRTFLAKKIMEVSYDYEGCFTEITTFNKICNLVIESILEFKNKTILVLLDEYENFLNPQQIILNTLIKRADSKLSYKVAMKYGGLSTYATLYDNQHLQETHDYFKIDLDYNISDNNERANYKKLLLGITSKMLGDKFANNNIQTLLVGNDSDDRVSYEQMFNQLEKMYVSKKTEFSLFTKIQIHKKISNYNDTLIFRELYDRKSRKRQYSGFDSFMFLSSGIVRYFLELCGMAFYLADNKGIDVFSMESISKEIQTEAVHTVSDALLDKLALGIEDHGELMQKFVMNIGELLRNKLIFDNSEPETIGIGIVGNDDLWNSTLKEIVISGIKESVIQKIPESRKKKEKNITDHHAYDLYLNRIYAPALSISHTARWRTIKVTVEEINEFLKSGRTSRTKLRMIHDLKKERNLDSSEKLDPHLGL